MSSLLYVGVLLAVVALMGVWAVAHARGLRERAQRREMEALALVQAGKDPVADAGPETIFAAGLPTRMPVRGGIEVSEVVDIDALLAGESPAAAMRARATLEEPTNIHTGADTLPPRPVVRAPASAAANPGAVAVSPPPAIAQTRAEPAKAEPLTIGSDVPLRELALTWFEARGYRGSLASPAVRPIELVLRHKNDPARAYAFVVEPQRVDAQRVARLLEQARSIGLIRLLVVADGGTASGAFAQRKGVRLVDRAALDVELRRLEVSVAAKIIAVARKRASARIAA
jgi:hypothetical protein